MDCFVGRFFHVAAFLLLGMFTSLGWSQEAPQISKEMKVIEGRIGDWNNAGKIQQVRVESGNQDGENISDRKMVKRWEDPVVPGQ